MMLLVNRFASVRLYALLSYSRMHACTHAHMHVHCSLLFCFLLPQRITAVLHRQHCHTCQHDWCVSFTVSAVMCALACVRAMLAPTAEPLPLR